MQQYSIGQPYKIMIYKTSDQDLHLEIIDIEKPPLPTAISNFKDSVQQELDDSWLKIYAKYHTEFQKQDGKASQDTMNYNDFLYLSLHLLRNHQTRLGVVPICNAENLNNSDSQDNTQSGGSSNSNSYIEVHYKTPECSLLDCLRYSPYKLLENPSSLLYVTYQILYWTQEFHSRSVPHGSLKLDNIFINEDFSIQLGLPNLNRVYELAMEDNAEQNSSPPSNLGSFESVSLAKMTERWVMGEIKNFDYLMFLNKLAGRRMNDPNHHPMLPWVTDFSVENGGWRDLSKSKFRLNKGDTQLDHQFLSSCGPELSSRIPTTDINGISDDSTIARNFHAGNLIGGGASMSGALIPHHVSDAMCDITYYSYKARCTSIDILCRYVRPQWRPQEYPSSVERMYQWTPDECIPELYTDPTIFKSIHSDMCDLALPKWCKNEDEFLRYHQRMLESEKVSQNLHKWIDITFGYKLLGEDAVQAKNVYLELVDQHKTLRKYGVTPLFHVPHPRKCPAQCDRYFAPERPLLPVNGSDTSEEESARTISLPHDYDPLDLLHRFSEYYTFIHHTTHRPPSPLPQPKSVKLPVLQKILREDILSVACLIVELFLFDHISPEQVFLPLWPDRFRICYSVAKENWGKLPSCMTLALDVIFSAIPEESLSPLSNAASPIHSFDYLPTPSHMLYLHCSFPTYMHSLNHLVNFITGVTHNGIVPSTKSCIDGFSEFLQQHGHSMPKSALRLVIPHLIAFMSNSDTQVAAACKLFPQFACLVGRQIVCEEILPTLLSIYSSENQPEGYHQLYSQHFLAQVLLHVGLKHFLAHLPHLLVQAISGCKDNALTKASGVNTSTVEDNRSYLHKLRSGSDIQRLSISSMEDTLRRELDSSVRVIPTRPNSIQPNSQSKFFLDSSDACPASQFHMEEICPDIDPSYPRTPSITLYDMHAVSSMRTRGSGSKDSLPSAVSPEPGESTSNLSNCSGSSSSLRIAHENRSKVLSIVDNKQLHMNQNVNGTAAYGSSAPCDSRLENLVSINTDLSSTLLDPTINWSPVKTGRSTSYLDKNTPNSSAHSTPVKKKSQTRLTMRNKPSSLIISDIASDSVFWLSEKLGPVVCTQYFSRNLLRMLVLCYSTKQHLTPHPHLKDSPLPMPVQTSRKVLSGDLYAAKPLLCLKRIACLYGISILKDQYLPFIRDCVEAGKKELTPGKTEGGLVASLVLLQQLVTYLPDRHLMDNLQEPILKEVLMNVIRLSSSFNVFFPSGAVGRRALLYKCIDVMYVLGLRLGFESTRSHMTEVFRRFFASFGRVHFQKSNHSDASCCQYLEEDDHEAEQSSTTDAEEDSGLESRLSEYYLIQMTPGSKEVVIDTPSTISVPLKSMKKTNISEQSNAPNMDDSISKSISRHVLMDEVSEELQQEMRDTFTAELAHLSYVPFCKLAGGIHIDSHLFNSELIHSLVSEHEKSQLSLAQDKRSSSSSSGISSPGVSSQYSRTVSSNVDSCETNDVGIGRTSNFYVDNQIIGLSHTGNSLSRLSSNFGMRSRHGTNAEEESTLVRCQDLEEDRGGRHLVNNWASYWSHEIGLNEKSKTFDVKQMRLLTLTGHMSTVRHIACLDAENSLLSCGKDKTVRLWSLHNHGYSGSMQLSSSGGHSAADQGIVKARFVYQKHRKSVFSAQFLETLRMVASCDGTLHLWDPFTGKQLTSTEPGAGRAPLSVVARIPAPHCTLIAGDTDNHLHVIDPRTGSLIHRMAFGAGGAGLSLGLSAYGMSGASVSQTAQPTVGGPSGSLRHVEVSPCGNILICAFLGGYITAIDRRIGCVLHSWRGHLDDINQVKFYSNDWFITTSQDNNITMWNTQNFSSHSLIGHPNEPIHCLDLYRNEIVITSSSNRLSVYRDINNYIQIGKLSPSILKSMITSFAILPLNRLVTAGSDSGSIVVFC